MKEEWRTVSDYPQYEVSSRGRVRSWKHRHHLLTSVRSSQPRLLSQKTSRVGYKEVNLHNDGKGTLCRVHRLVLYAFSGPPPTPNSQAAHLNGVKADNQIENLSWVSPAVNSSHKRAHGTVPNYKGVSADKARAISVLNAAGFSENVIAKLLTVSQRSVHQHLAS
jgi:hypothetical protein